MKPHTAALLIALLLIAGAGNPPLDWGAKELKFPSQMGRIKFPVYLPSETSEFYVSRVTVVWIPKLDAYPSYPARQAARLTLRNKSGQTVELIQTPTLKGKNAWATTSFAQSQGYLDLPMKAGQTNVSRTKGLMSVGVISSELSQDDLTKVADSLAPFELPAGKKL